MHTLSKGMPRGQSIQKRKEKFTCRVLGSQAPERLAGLLKKTTTNIYGKNCKIVSY